MSDVQHLWRDRLDGVTAVSLGRGLEPDRLADRYDATTREEIHDLTNQAFREVLRGGNSVMTLDDLDIAAEKLDTLGDHEVVTDGGVDERVECCGAVPIDAEAIPVAVVEELAENWTDDAELFLDAADGKVTDEERSAALQQLSCAEQIEELAERYQHTATKRDGGEDDA